MTQDLRQLIDKINQEGVKAAEEQARLIEQGARDLAKQITQDAKKQAQELIAQAKNEIRMAEEKNKALMQQAGRDLLLSLRAQINTLLGRIVAAEIKKVLSPQELASLIAQLVKNIAVPQSQKVIATLKNEDCQALQDNFIAALKEETKKDIILKPSADILAGFTISFDNGKSHFDFSDKALAEYIGTYLKPRLAEILKEID